MRKWRESFKDEMFPPVEDEVLLHPLRDDVNPNVWMLTDRRYYEVRIVAAKIVEKDGNPILFTELEITAAVSGASELAGVVIVIPNLILLLYRFTADVTVFSESEVLRVERRHDHSLVVEEKVDALLFYLKKAIQEAGNASLTR